MTFINIRANKKRDPLGGPTPIDRAINFDEDGLMEEHLH